jgi:Terminase small subunit
MRTEGGRLSALGPWRRAHREPRALLLLRSAGDQLKAILETDHETGAARRRLQDQTDRGRPDVTGVGDVVGIAFSFERVGHERLDLGAVRIGRRQTGALVFDLVKKSGRLDGRVGFRNCRHGSLLWPEGSRYNGGQPARPITPVDGLGVPAGCSPLALRFRAHGNVTADATVRELGRIAHCDIRKFYDEHGHLKPLHELPDDLAACIASIEVVRRRVIGVDVASAGPAASETGGTFEVVYKVRFWNKLQALELLGRHQGLFREDAQQPIAHVPAFCLPEGCNGVSVQ